MASPFDVNFAPYRLPTEQQPSNPLQRSRVDSLVSGIDTLRRPAAPPASSVYFSPTKRQFMIGGQLVDERNEAGVLNAFNGMTGSPTSSPGGDFQPVDPTSFGAYVDRIANPDLGRRFAKNFESASAGMGELAGAGLRFLGAEELGSSIQDANSRRIAELSPYQMGLEDIDGSRSNGVIDWFAGVVGQFGPSIVESVVVATLGAAAGAVAGGGPNPLTAVGGALAALSGKQAVKQATLAAAKKHLAGETLDAAERKLLTEQASIFAAAAEKNPGFVNNIIYGNIPAEQFGAQAVKAGGAEALRRGRNQAIVGGAGAASAANSYAMGVSDIYREGLESGFPDRTTAALGGIPYGALDLLPEFLLARRVLGDIGANAATKLSTMGTTRAKAVELLKRGAKGGAVGGLLEGGTEAGQEALLLAANPLIDWNSPEGISRLLNSFAAGAAIGGPIGSLANLRDNKEPVNLLKPTESVGVDRPDAPDTAPGTALAPVSPEVPPPTGGGTAVGPAAAPADFSAPYGEFSEPGNAPGLPSPSYEQQLLPSGPDLLEGPAAQTAPAVPATPNPVRQPAMYPGQAFLQQARTPTSQAGQAFGRVGMEPIPSPDASGQGNLFNARFQRGPQQAASIEENLGGYQGPDAQMGMFSDRFPLLEETGSDLKRRNIRQKNATISWLNSLTEAEVAKLEPVFGSPDEMYQTLKASRSPRQMLQQMQSVLGNAKSTGKVVAKGKDGLIRKVEVPPDEPPEPPKPKGTKAAPLKKGKVNKPQIKVVAPIKREATKAESEMETYMKYVDEADAGKKTAREAIEFYAKSTDEDGVSPEVRKAAQDYLRDTVVEEKAKPQATTKLTSLGKLMAYLDTIIYAPEQLANTTNRLIAQGKIRALYKEAVAITPGGVHAVRGASYNYRSLGDYITADGQLKLELNEEDQIVRIVAQADEPMGQFKRVDNDTNINGTIPPGRVKMFVKDFASRLNVKPKISVFRNVADLKASNPELFKRAKVARKAGDFETTDAVGYAFGDEVIIFSDYVRTEDQLRFVLAHEAIGHFGLRSILGREELSRVLNSIYAADHRVRTLVDRMVEATGMSREEAIEEWLADYAAEIDTSLLKRLWAALKNALNKLGIKFDDDMARLLIGQSRRYVRDGIPGSFFSAENVMEHMTAMQQDSDEGRFSTETWGKADLGSTWVASNAVAFPTLRKIGDIPDFLRRQKGGLAHLSRMALEAIQTLDNKATRSEGLSQVFSLFQAQGRAARAYLSDYNEMLREFTHGIKTTEKDKALAGEFLAYSALTKSRQMSENILDQYDRLVTTDELGGDIKINEEVFEAIKKAGLTTAEEFRNGVTFEDSTGTTQRWQFDVDEDSRAWKIYLEQREAIAKAALDLLLANFESVNYKYRTAIDKIGYMAKGAFTQKDKDALRSVVRKYEQLRREGMTTSGSRVSFDPAAVQLADDFLVNATMALDRMDILKQWQGGDAVKGSDAVPNVFKTDDYKDVVKSLETLHNAGWVRDSRLRAQQLVRNIMVDQASALDAERYAKRTILGSYVPFKRRGKFQVRLSAYDDKGRLVHLADDVRGVMYYGRSDSRADLEHVANELDKIYGGKTWKLNDADGVTREVTLKPEYAEAAQTGNDFGDINFNEVLHVLEQTGNNLTPQGRERLVELLEAQNSRARSNLQRTANPGWDKDVIRNNAEWLEMNAHVAAKRLYRNRIDDTLSRDSLWRGDDERLRLLKAAVDAESDPLRKARKRREYDEYAYKYYFMKDAGPDSRPNYVEINGKKRRTVGDGERYREEARALLRWYSSQTNINDSTEDMLQGPISSRLKTAVVFAQLGGTLATAAVNSVSLLTHTIPFAAFYNPASASGMGFGTGNAARNVVKAIGNSFSYKLGELDHLEKIMATKTWDKYGMTEDEVQFLIDQTRSGPLQAVLPDALLGTARGKITNAKVQFAAQAWMSMFSYTEKLNRRVTALAVYRMEKERSRAEGLSDGSAIRSATKAALEAVDKTQGEYSMFNRPRMARGNIFSYVFMYKMFPIITVQMLKRMPLKGKLTMLGMMLLLSGVKGLPFADDIMDLLDTLLQKLGIKIGSVEAELYRAVDEMLPGMGNQAMRGVIDKWVDATFSTRFSTGDLIPLTGALKAGADPWRETANFFGPMLGGLFGFGSSVMAMTGMAADTLGGRPTSTTLLDVARSSPIALARALGDTLAYMDNNAITNQYGRVISPGVDPAVLIFRALGFYPAAATRANDYIRVGKQSRDYMLEVSKAFKDAYIKAALANGGRGDPARMNQILAEVNAWNEDAAGTGLEVKNFTTSVKKAIKEARRPAGERFLKTTPLSMRGQVDELMDIYGAK